MKSSEDKETLDKSDTKILKSKGPRTLENTRENGMNRRKRGKGLYTRICYMRFVRNEQISERAG